VKARRIRPRRGPTAAVRAGLLALLLAVSLGGCGLGAGATPGQVAVTVTAEFGQRQLPGPAALKVVGQETVMSLLERNYQVTTRYGGKFVQSIGGLGGGSEGGEPVDWFYYVNGVEAEKGAAATNVNPGDQIWWDHHDWSQTDSVPAVVGSFPEPFLHGYGGQRYPVAVVCTSVTSGPCKKVLSRLRELGVPAAVAAAGSGGEPDVLRVLVGPFRKIANDSTVATIAKGPAASGVYVTFSAHGTAMNLLHADGHAVRAPSDEVGLLAATREPEDAPVWVVTGTTEAGVAHAADAFDELDLHDHFAIAAGPAGVLPLPVPGR
jgi:prepilin-type processing-associated H-X9-DG protein